MNVTYSSNCLQPYQFYSKGFCCIRWDVKTPMKIVVRSYPRCPKQKTYATLSSWHDKSIHRERLRGRKGERKREIRRDRFQKKIEKKELRNGRVTES